MIKRSKIVDAIIYHETTDMQQNKRKTQNKKVEKNCYLKPQMV